MTDLEQTKELLHQVVEILNGAVQVRKEQLEAVSKMILESEERIDRTNKMISDMTDLMKSLTATYEHHLNGLTVCRDNLAAEVTRLTEIISKQERELSKERDRYQDLLKQLIILAQSSKADTNINLK